jgi:hypothetical protein
MSRWLKLDRRQFVRSLALGAGAPLLAPLTERLVAQAWGQPQKRKRVAFVLEGQGFWEKHFTPVEFRAGMNPIKKLLDAPKEFTWPEALRPLEPYRQRMLIIDGLPNRVGQSQHTGGFAMLSCLPCARGIPEGHGPPGGPSIDQFIASGIGQASPHKSVLFGASAGAKVIDAKVFGAARERPEPHYTSPFLLWKRLFGSIGTAGQLAAAKRRFLFDSIRTDLKKLNANLAAPERVALDSYLAVMDDFESRQKQLQVIACDVPGEKPKDDGDPAKVAAIATEDKLQAMNEMAILALACGLTNVVGMSGSCGHGHGDVPSLGSRLPQLEGVKVGYYGHGPSDAGERARPIIHQFFTGMIARMASTLSGIKEAGGASIFDSMTIVYWNDNGHDHHDGKERCPIVLVGNAGGALRADGRFLRFGGNREGTTCIADLFCSVSTALGVPTDSFGKGGYERVTGPIPAVTA